LRQIKVSLTEDLIAELEAAAEKERRSLSEEVRERIMGTAGRVDLGRPDISDLLDKVAELAILAEFTTKQRWDRDAATAYLLQLAVTRHLQRHGAKEVGEIPTSETFRREGLVASTNPSEIATAMEAVVNFKLKVARRLADEQRRLADEIREHEREIAVTKAEIEDEIRERGKQ
jgi:hypothetical protein